MTGLGRFFPWIVVGIVALYLLMLLMPPWTSPGQMNLYEFGQLPVQSGGRIKPLDSVARTTMLIISNRQTWRDKQGNVRPAVEWLLDTMTSKLDQKGDAEDAGKRGRGNKPSPAETHKLFRIENPELLDLLHQKARPGDYRYSIVEMAPHFAEFDDKAHRALKKDPTERDLLERKVLELRRHIEMYLELSQWVEPRLIPPKGNSPHWQTLLEAVAHERSTGEENKAVRYVGAIMLAYAGKEAEKFNESLEDYRDYLKKNHPEAMSAAGFEAAFNQFEPFYQCSILYALAFLMTCIGWLIWREPLRQSAFWLIALIFVLHTGALLARIWISGRPPVTNLYSSAIFIGWGTVLMGMILERIYPLGIGNFVSTVCGSATVLVAHFLGTSGDTLDVLQAVLDTNFWLATHVTCITFGYAATYVAGLLGMAYILLGVATPILTRELGKTLAQAMYGVVCFAMFLSFTGTVLGGIWADQSWGRFWGWDPKENGALLIVLINALVLHARWGGMAKERGMAILNILGNIVTTWSWFGVNELGVGLHSYGFREGMRNAIVVASLFFLAFIIVGLLPRHLWVSESMAPAPKKRVSRGERRAATT